MFERIGRVVVHNPWKVIGIWVLAAFAIVAFSPKLTDITNSDQTSFLPDSYESVEATKIAEKAFPTGKQATALVVFKRQDGAPLGVPDQGRVTQVAGELNAAGIDRVKGVVSGPESLSPNHSVQLANIALDGQAQDQPVVDAVKKVREKLSASLQGSGLKAGVTGDAALMLDNQDSFKDGEKLIGIATIVIIIGLLLFIFRSPVAALLPVVSVGLVFTVSTSLIALAGKAFDFQVGQELGSLLTVVMFGIGTDYILFLLFRYRERLRAGDDPKQAMATAVARVGEAIASAAGAVIVAFSALVLSTLGSFATLGPGLAIAVATMLVAGLTLIPAIVSLLGTKVFWPSKKQWQQEHQGTLSAKTGKLVGRRPALVAGVSGLVMVGLAVGALGFTANYDQIDQLPSDTESSQTFKDMQQGFPAGALNPTKVIVVSTNGAPLSQDAVTRVATAVGGAEGVGKAMAESLRPNATVGQISVLLKESPFSNAALDLVEKDGPVRNAAHAAAAPDTRVLVGGQTSAFADVRQATNRDLTVIFPVAAVLIALILGLLLRSIVAPIYLMIAVVVNFLATLGATVIVFQGFAGNAGLMFSLPIILYLFVVAIGTDYNILMIARLREEAREGKDPRTAADLAVEHAGPSVAAAGVILAGTFAALMLAGVSLLTQMGFAVAIGIVLSAFVMSMFFVPAFTAMIGHKAWWPGHGDEPRVKAVEQHRDDAVRSGL
ncbi:RND superfamily putative drug exporter [Herbihabitans rhizosphaerae]|uniref:RND superfamily putative drug exporter n=1 Tax=Herbihabitans rhizosphaerae TaxID=1872711 RepID=A0A4Q7KLE3_9PSEU|nr:MMPL family transporter [Herbihabitans rhizosphaerae]RZS34766.1 RND superfamily putative drug exporter [Herbihabitans rhizosphaerae]